MLKINITTLGCPKNVVDSWHLTKSFISEGFIIVDDIKDADIFLINTCGFIKDAKEESIEEILNLIEIKKGLKSGVWSQEKIQNSKKLIVFGCLAKRYRNELLKEIPEIDGIFLYLYPTEINNELLEFIVTEDKVQKYLDIPLQHSEDRILRLMGRKGTRKEYLKLINSIRRNIPQVALRTTFIVGFPGETEKDFKGLMDFIEDVRFDRLGVFKYSKEEGTPSARLKGQIPEKVKNKRFDEIMSRQVQISLEKNRELIGRRYEAIVDEVWDDVIIARLYSHAPEIDGVVIVHNELSGRQAHHSSLSLKVGDIVNVEIEDALEYDLKGRVVLHSTTESAIQKHRVQDLHKPHKDLIREENASWGKPQIVVL